MTTEASQPSCQSVEERLGELLDLGDPPESDAPPSEARELLGHVRSCDRCQRSLELYRKTVAILRSVPDVPVPDDFLSWVQDGLRPPRKVSQSRWPGGPGFPVRLAVAAMILCGLGLGAFFFQGRERSPAEGRLVADLEERGGSPEAFLRKARTPSPPASASSRGARPKLKSAEPAEPAPAELPELPRVRSARLASSELGESKGPPRGKALDRAELPPIELPVSLEPARFAEIAAFERDIVRRYGLESVSRTEEGGEILVSFHFPRARLHELRRDLAVLEAPSVARRASRARRGEEGRLDRRSQVARLERSPERTRGLEKDLASVAESLSRQPGKAKRADDSLRKEGPDAPNRVARSLKAGSRRKSPPASIAAAKPSPEKAALAAGKDVAGKEAAGAPGEGKSAAKGRAALSPGDAEKETEEETDEETEEETESAESAPTSSRPSAEEWVRVRVRFLRRK